ncbi:hypothetical protein N9D31_01510 [Oligoflexaceae bacterium]|nr:hypothetical protein [Oligoflexaceae bacterium]
MIKINLAPEEELENKLWFVPLVIGAALLFFVSSYALEVYLDDIRVEIEIVENETKEHQRGFEELKSKQEEFKVRDAERGDLENRLAALQRITESKILRFRPVILLEHLQNLKPEGIWFSEVSLLKTQPVVSEEFPRPAAEIAPTGDVEEGAGEGVEEAETETKPAPLSNSQLTAQRINDEADKHSIKIVGRAFDNILVAEFLSALKSTQMQEVDPASLRTMVYFSEIELKQTVAAKESVIGPRPREADGQNNGQNNDNITNQIFTQNGLASPGQSQPETQTRAAEEEGEIVTEFEITLKFREHPSPLKGTAMQTYSFRPNFSKKFTMY